MTTVIFKRKASIMVVLVLIAIITYGFAAGYFNPSNSTNLSKKDSELTNSVNDTLSDSNNNPISTPTPSPAPTPTPIPIPVDYTINDSSHITLTINIDLNDGMNRDEAILVAQQLFAYAHSHATYELKSAEVNDAGVWTVSLPWGAVSPDGSQESHSHFFIATIDPATRTVEFSTCF